MFIHADISGDVKSSVLVAACYFGPPEQWSVAGDAWAALLAEAGVKVFHATDFYACRRDFKDWTLNDARHVEFAKRFAAVADDAGLTGFAFGVDRVAFESVLVPVLRDEKRRLRAIDARTFALMGCLGRVANYLEATKWPRQFKVRVFVESEEGGNRYSAFFDDSASRRERWTSWFAGIRTADKSLVPMQIADLLAHEGWRRVQAVVDQTGRRVRKSLSRMMLRERVEIHLLGEKDATENAERFRRILLSHPNGLQTPG
jgi:hypothetical protein